MITQRRAIPEIQGELNLINQKCGFERNWTALCVQFFTINEQKIPHIPFSYKEFSIGLLYYIIRMHDKSINREYFLHSVISKAGVRQKIIFKIYRELCVKFGTPPDQIDYDVMWKNIAEYLEKKYQYETDWNEFEGLTNKYPQKKFSQIRGLKTLFYRAQKSPKLYLQNQIEQFIINSFSEMKLL